MTAPGLRLDGVTIAGADGRPIAVPDVQLAPGDRLVITGNGGNAPSILLSAIAGLVPPVTGRITLDGQPVGAGMAGYSSQQHELIGGLTAAENIAVRILAKGRISRSEWRAIENLLEELVLPESSWHNLLEQLSGGQQQRVAIARALVGVPHLICLDDPTSELDEVTAGTVWAAIERRADQGSILVVATAPSTADDLGWKNISLAGMKPSGGTLES